MWPQIIGSIATGLTGVLVAVAGLLTARTRGSSEALTSCREELQRSERHLLVALRHLYRLERMLANTGATVPPRPQQLTELVN